MSLQIYLEIGLLVLAAIIAVVSLASLMRRRREELVSQLRGEMEIEKKRLRAEKKSGRNGASKPNETMR